MVPTTAYHVLSLCEISCTGKDCYIRPYAVASITGKIEITRVVGNPAILQVEILKRDVTAGSDSSNRSDCIRVTAGPFGLPYHI